MSADVEAEFALNKPVDTVGSERPVEPTSAVFRISGEQRTVAQGATTKHWPSAA